MSDSENEEFTKNHLKVCFIGDSNTGKTSLIHRYCEDTLPSGTHTPTVGVDFFAHEARFPCTSPSTPAAPPGQADATEASGALKEKNATRELRVSLKICDVGGRAVGGHMLGSYLHSSHIIVLVYDVTSMQSFEALATWIKFAKDNVEDTKTVLAVVGNKSDLEHQRAVRLDKTQSFCDKHNMRDYLVSARNGDGVVSAFQNIIATFFKMKPIEERSQMMLGQGVASHRTSVVSVKSGAEAEAKAGGINKRKIPTKTKKKSKRSAICSLQ